MFTESKSTAKKNNNKKEVSAVEFYCLGLTLKGLGPSESKFRCKCSKKKEKKKENKKRNDQRRESLPHVYWTHCIPDFFCKEKLFIKKVSSFSNSVQLIEGPESRRLSKLLRGRASQPRMLGGFFFFF